MRHVSLTQADAFLLGPEAQQVPMPLVGAVGTYRTKKGIVRHTRVAETRVLETKNGMRVVIPTSRTGRELSVTIFLRDWAWPVLPLVKHRGGYFTGTARAYIEHRMVAVESLWDKVGDDLPRTAHRVFWAERLHDCLVSDVIKRSDGEQRQPAA